MSIFSEAAEIDRLKKINIELEEKIEDYKDAIKDGDADIKALIFLSTELSRLGYRDLDASSCKAAIKAIEALQKEIKDARQA